MEKKKASFESDTMYTPNKQLPLDRFNNFIYNEDTGEIFGRTPKSWAKIGLFYIIFYGVLAVLVAICMWTFLQSIDPRTPRWQKEKSLIGTNPGLGFRPMPPEDQVESTLIWYKGTNAKDYKYWKDALIKFLAVYKTPGLTPGRGQNIHNCDFNNLPVHDQVCDVDIKKFAPCTEENNFNFHKSAPCIFLKLNKIYGWIPEYYNETSDLPTEMPEDLRLHINEISKTNKLMMNMVWVSCSGENPADIENLGPLHYYPFRGFPSYFYPFENSVGYLSPLVAVHLARPKTGILINVECRAWARNIKYNRHERVGTVHFELMID